MRIIELPKDSSTYRKAVIFAALAGLMATLLLVMLPNPAVRAKPSKGGVSGPVITNREMARFRPLVSVASGGIDAGSDGVHGMMQKEMPTVTIEVITDSVAETMGPMRFRLNASPAAGADVYVTLEAEQPERAAWLPNDYREAFSVKIPAGIPTLEFVVPVLNYFNREGDGSITLSIVADDDEYLVGVPMTAEVSITDDDVPITVAYSDAGDIRVSEGDGAVTVQLKISVDGTTKPGTYDVDGVISEGIPFLIETFPGTAVPPDDYTNAFHIVQLPVGSFAEQTSGERVAEVSLEWEIHDDALDEGEDEHLYVVTPSSAVSWLTLPDEPKRIVIEDNDVAEILLLIDALEIDEGESVEIWVLLRGDTRFADTQVLQVEFGGIAEEGHDYEVDSDVLTIEARARLSTEVLILRALEDSVVETPEAIEVKVMRDGEVAANGASISITDRAVSTLVLASVDGSAVTLTYDENLDENSTPDATAFEVKVDNVEISVTNVAVAGLTVTLDVDPAVEAGHAVIVSYEVPASMPLLSTDAEPVTAIEGVEAKNNTENRPPRILTTDATLEFSSDVPVGTSIVTLQVVDADASQVLSLTLEGDDEDNFDVTTDGEWANISVKRAIDREATRSYEIVLKVDDGNGGTASAEITVTFLRLGQPGEVAMIPDRPKQSLPVAANLTDDDGIAGAVDWEWAVSDAANGTFVSVQMSTSNVYVPTAGDVGMFVKATALYEDTEGNGRRAETVSTEPVGTDVPDDMTTDGRIVVDGGPESGYIDPGYVTFSINGAGVCSDVHRVFDHDWWGVEVVEGRNYVIEMRGADTGDGTLLETRLWGMANTNGERRTDAPYGDVYDAYSDLGSGSGRNSRMLFTAVETGLVYVDVSSNNSMTVDTSACPINWTYPDRQTGSYEVEVTSVPGVLQGQADATPITAGSSVTGVFNRFERRWFVVSLASGVEYRIVNQGGSEHSSKLNFPVIYGVYDRYGATLPDSSDGRNGYGDAIVTVRPEVTGDYYIQIGDGTQGGVWVNGGPSGAFELAINQTGQ